MDDQLEPARPGASLGASDDTIRASDAEREATMRRLRDAAAEGRLTFEELADRIEVSTVARTRGELTRLTSDLPAPGDNAGLSSPSPSGLPTPRPAALPTRRSTIFGDVRCTGQWEVPAEGKWETLFGDVVLDLREATVTAQEMHIDAGTVFGDVDLLVPEGIVVEVRSRTFLGDVKQQAGAVGHPGAPRVVLTGGTVFGDVRVRSQRLSERLLDRVRRRDDGS